MTVFKGMRYLFAGIPTRPFDILYNMHSFASFLQSARDLQPNDWSVLVTLDVLWWRCKTSSCPALDHFKFIYLCSGVRVPDSTAVFQDRSNKGEVSKFLFGLI